MPGRTKSCFAAAPGEDDSGLCGFRGGDGGFVVLFPLFRGDPGEADLGGMVGGVAFDGDFNGVRAGGEIDSRAQVVEAVGGGHQAVFAAEDGVAVDAAAHAVGSGDALAVNFDGAGRAEQLQVDPVGAGGGDVEIAFPGERRCWRAGRFRLWW